MDRTKHPCLCGNEHKLRRWDSPQSSAPRQLLPSAQTSTAMQKRMSAGGREHPLQCRQSGVVGISVRDPDQPLGHLQSGRSTNEVNGRRGWSRELCDQLATSHHWITSSARSSSDCGIVSPSAFAVLRLMTNSNFVGCSTGRSAGLAPFKILSTYFAALWKVASRSDV
jgi:hypothetical protein